MMAARPMRPRPMPAKQDNDLVKVLLPAGIVAGALLLVSKMKR